MEPGLQESAPGPAHRRHLRGRPGAVHNRMAFVDPAEESTIEIGEPGEVGLAEGLTRTIGYFDKLLSDDAVRTQLLNERN